MKKLARACLRLALLAVPVVIAACYGMAARFQKNGNVIDKDSHESLNDISVRCIGTDGLTKGSALSYEGSYNLMHDEDCASLEASDTQTPVRYVEQKAIPYSTATISMEKVK